MRIISILLVLTLLFFFSSISSATTKSSASLVISGGISLGVYEAGLNYVLVESLKDTELNLPTLVSVTGSSAGAINTLATALSYCSLSSPKQNILNNSFRDIWSHIGLEQLLPGTDTSNNEKTIYDSLFLGGLEANDQGEIVSDGLLARSAFKDAIKALRDKANNYNYKPDCSVSIGIMVTRAEANRKSLTLNNGSKYSFDEQSYAIPLKIKIVKFQDGWKPVFENDLNYQYLALKSGIVRPHIFLPQDHNGHVSFDSIARAVLASSAFPAAFGPVKLGYCSNNSPLIIDSAKDLYNCPNGLFYDTSKFIDGGFFNNIPIGLAAELTALHSCEKAYKSLSEFSKSQSCNKVRPAVGSIDTDRSETYFFMDPDQIRSRKPDEKKEDISTSWTEEQLAGVLSSVGTLRADALVNDMNDYFSKDSPSFRSYSPIGRFPELTGELLFYFGAFMDPLFRDHDYAAGVYDGLIYVSTYVCTESINVDQCKRATFLSLLSKFIKNIDDNINQKDIEALEWLVASFLNQEKYYDDGLISLSEALPPKLVNPNTQTYDYIIKALGTSNMALEHTVFLRSLAGQYEKENDKKSKDKTERPVSNNTNYAIFRPDYWPSAMIKQIFARLKNIDEEQGKLFAGVYILSTDDIIAVDNLAADRFPDQGELRYRVIPNRLGFDPILSTASVYYALAIPGRLLWTYSGYLELFGGYNFATNQTGINPDYLDAGLGVRFTKPSIGFSSWGVGFSANKNTSNTLVNDDILYGVELNAGFLAEKFRISVGTRSINKKYHGTDLSLKLSISNLDEIIWALSK